MDFIRIIWNNQDFVIGFCKVLMHIASSSYDVITDFANANSYLSNRNINYNHVCNETANDCNSKVDVQEYNPVLSFRDDYDYYESTITSNHSDYYGNTFCCNNTILESSKSSHENWGRFMIFIIFMPGLFWACRPRMRMGKTGRIKRFLGLVFPLYALGYGYYALKNARNEKVQKRLTLICACEAFFESVPQIILLCYTFSYKETTISTPTILSLVGSVFLVAYAIVGFDIESGGLKLNTIKDFLVYVLKLAPLYAVGTIFRITSLSLTVIYLKWYAIIPAVILIGLMILLVGATIEWNLDVIYFMALTNVTVPNIGMIRMTQIQMDDGGEESNKLPGDIERRCRRFITISSYLTFLHHTIVLSIVLYLICSGQGFRDGDEMHNLLNPTREWPGTHIRNVYIPFSIVIMIGTLDVLVTSATSRWVKFGEQVNQGAKEIRMGSSFWE